MINNFKNGKILCNQVSKFYVQISSFLWTQDTAEYIRFQKI